MPNKFNQMLREWKNMLIHSGLVWKAFWRNIYKMRHSQDPEFAITKRHTRFHYNAYRGLNWVTTFIVTAANRMAADVLAEQEYAKIKSRDALTNYGFSHVESD